MSEITSPARMEHLERLIRFVAGHAERAGFPIHRIKEIELAAEEILVNIFNYAYPGVEGDVSITCRAGPAMPCHRCAPVPRRSRD
ncbi:MAG: ATP-binding protein, partial [Candidatus Desulfacyla sp.]